MEAETAPNGALMMASRGREALDVDAKAARRAHQWLIGWGAVVRERYLSGDPSALPKSISLSGGEGLGGSRSAPGSLLGVAEVYLSVEATLGPRERILRLALEAKYAFGCIEIPESYSYHFSDHPEPRVILASERPPYEPVEEEPLNYVRRDVQVSQRFDLVAGYGALEGRLGASDAVYLRNFAESIGCSVFVMLADVASRYQKKTLPIRAGL